jgi:hypothetical protein
MANSRTSCACHVGCEQTVCKPFVLRGERGLQQGQAGYQVRLPWDGQPQCDCFSSLGQLCNQPGFSSDPCDPCAVLTLRSGESGRPTAQLQLPFVMPNQKIPCPLDRNQHLMGSAGIKQALNKWFRGPMHVPAPVLLQSGTGPDQIS